MMLIPKNNLLYCSYFVLFLLSPWHTQAQLSWNKVDMLKEAKAEQKCVEFPFIFFNTTEHTYQIQKIATSCSCTTTNLKINSIFLPGTGSQFNVVIDITNKTALLSKTVALLLRDEDGNTFYENVKCIVKIEDVLRAFPSNIKLVPSSTNAKEIQLIPVGSNYIKEASCESYDARVSCSLRSQDGRDWFFTIGSGNEPIDDARVSLEVLLSNGIKKVYFITAEVPRF